MKEVNKMSRKFISAKSKTDSSVTKSLEIADINVKMPNNIKDLMWLHLFVSKDKHSYEEIMKFLNDVDLSELTYVYKVKAAPDEYVANDIEMQLDTYKDFSADIDVTYANGLYEVRLLAQTEASNKIFQEAAIAEENAVTLTEVYDYYITMMM